MIDTISTAAQLTPIGAVLVLAALAQVAIVQIAKQRAWSKAHTQSVAAGVATLLGLVAAVVLGMITGIPDSIVQIVSSIVLSIAAVAVLGQALYKTIGHTIPDGTTPEHGRRARRDGEDPDADA